MVNWHCHYRYWARWIDHWSDRARSTCPTRAGHPSIDGIVSLDLENIRQCCVQFPVLGVHWVMGTLWQRCAVFLAKNCSNSVVCRGWSSGCITPLGNNEPSEFHFVGKLAQRNAATTTIGVAQPIRITFFLCSPLWSSER